MLSFEEYQQRAAGTAIYPRVFVEREDGSLQEANFIYPALGLGGECGESLEKIKKLIRDKRGVVDDASRDAIAKELGDQLWYIAAVAKEFNLSMDYIAQANLNKLAARKERGVLGGSGDNR